MIWRNLLHFDDKSRADLDIKHSAKSKFDTVCRTIGTHGDYTVVAGQEEIWSKDGGFSGKR